MSGICYSVLKEGLCNEIVITRLDWEAYTLEPNNQEGRKVCMLFCIGMVELKLYG